LGRPKGSRNKKANGSDPSDRITHHDNLAPVGDLTDEQLEALTHSHVDKYEQALSRKKLADAEMKLVCKVAKADGIHLADIKAYIAAKTEEGQEKLREDAERIRRMERWFKFATQTDLFAPDADPAPVGNRSYRLGKEAGMSGEKAVVPTNCDHETYMAGWHAGQKQMMEAGISQTPPAEDFH
jgi:hypothetical protein